MDAIRLERFEFLMAIRKGRSTLMRAKMRESGEPFADEVVGAEPGPY